MMCIKYQLFNLFNLELPDRFELSFIGNRPIALPLDEGSIGYRLSDRQA